MRAFSLEKQMNDTGTNTLVRTMAILVEGPWVEYSPDDGAEKNFGSPEMYLGLWGPLMPGGPSSSIPKSATEWT